MKLPPEIHERVRYGKKAAKHKPYAIEMRSTRGKFWTTWHVWSRYETREHRDQALPGIVRKYTEHLHWEFRAKDPE